MSAIALLASSPAYSEASQIIPTINGVIQSINSNALIGSTSPTSLRNTVIGGDFGTNPWQRGTAFTSIANTLTYTADRFWALGGASSSISVSRITSGILTGFAAGAQFGRAAANADVSAIKLGTVFTSANSAAHQGVPFVISFYAKAGANFSSASSVLGVTVGTGTGASESAANFASGAWTGYAGVTLTGSTGATATGVTVTTSWARYSLAGFIPATATQVGFNFVYTPVGTAGANDWVQFAGIQFEQMPQGGVNPTPFERRPSGMELDLCQHYFWQVNEPASTVALFFGQCLTTSTAHINITFPSTMRAAPTTLTTTLGSMTGAIAAGTATAASTLAAVSSSATVDGFRALLTVAATPLVAGNATQLLGGAGVGLISASAEL